MAQGRGSQKQQRTSGSGRPDESGAGRQAATGASTGAERRQLGPLDESGAPLPPGAGENTVWPPEDAIRRRAYERYLARGCADGCADGDWLEAERELKSQGPGRAGSGDLMA